MLWETDPISRIYDAPERASLSSLIQFLFLLLFSVLILWTIIIWMDATAPYFPKSSRGSLLPHIRAFRQDYVSYVIFSGCITISKLVLFSEKQFTRSVKFTNHIDILCKFYIQRSSSRDQNQEIRWIEEAFEYN